MDTKTSFHKQLHWGGRVENQTRASNHQNKEEGSKDEGHCDEHEFCMPYQSFDFPHTDGDLLHSIFNRHDPFNDGVDDFVTINDIIDDSNVFSIVCMIATTPYWVSPIQETTPAFLARIEQLEGIASGVSYLNLSEPVTVAFQL